jgi:2'-hydroxyisoflavone reductase
MRSTRRDLLKFGDTRRRCGSAALLRLVRARPRRRSARAAKPLNILILGGTGFTGPFQVNYALSRGHKVTLFNRGKRPSPEWPGEVEQLHGDRNTGDLKSLAGRKWDVVHRQPHQPAVLGARCRPGAEGQRRPLHVHLDHLGVRRRQQARHRRDTRRWPCTRARMRWPRRSRRLRADIENLYGPLKALSEAEVRKHFGERTTIVRPGYIVGPRDETDRFTYWPLRVAQGGEMLVPGDGQDPDPDHRWPRPRRMDDPPGRGQGTTGVFNAVGPDYDAGDGRDALRLPGGHRRTGVQLTHVSPRSSSTSSKVDLPIWVPSRRTTRMPATARSAMRAHWPPE